ncbi:hypothetical protein AA0113_g7915 [Alternaria arborescens]|jgi:hypothetical protein|uniref:Uncharacterized protein n=1 Tax=Alternaria arborescens TaxID=156630 RepID=A0A4V1X462_9PLEO|nr:hypothetical protein AA0111_g7779 [Alternaria arborescens]RYO26817.1 hypothetical protein AA0111_g7779 [Alternaria arborescens]RYO58378.1 hypothetical protein AA0113_g7915 [Alternaria arborescens]
MACPDIYDWDLEDVVNHIFAINEAEIAFGFIKARNV